MNSLKLITLSGTVIVSLMLLLLLINFSSRHDKSKLDFQGNLKISFAIWAGAIFSSGLIILSNVISVIFEAIDNLIKIKPLKIHLELIKTTTLILGSGFISLLFSIVIVNTLIRMLRLKNSEKHEMENDPIGYFLLKAIFLISFTLSFSPVLAALLHSFIPNIEIPFYH